MNPLLSRNFAIGAATGLPGANSRSDEEFIAQLRAGLGAEREFSCLFQIELLHEDGFRATKYTNIEVNTKQKKRPISKPDAPLMALQRLILRRLPHNFVGNSAYAYVPGRSAIQCASKHTGMIWGVKLDIAGFFHQIREMDVGHLFRSWGFSKAAATGYAKILTQPIDSLPSSLNTKPGGRLPQGAPTSGAIANFVCTELDARLERFAELNGFVYTRYSDDILISSRNPEFSREAAVELLREISSILKHFGLSLNTSKTRIYGPSAAKHYLGLIIGEYWVRLPRHYRRKIESVAYCLEKFGLRMTESFYRSRPNGFRIGGEPVGSVDGSAILMADPGKTASVAVYFLTRFVGQIAYINQIDSGLARSYARKCIEAINADLVFFDNHYSLNASNWIRKSLSTISGNSNVPDWGSP